jgi:hypothetical protein
MITGKFPSGNHGLPENPKYRVRIPTEAREGIPEEISISLKGRAVKVVNNRIS